MRHHPKLLISLSLVSIGLWAVSGLPLWVGWWATPDDQVYQWRIPAAAADTPAYYSNILQAKSGQILLSNQFTSEPQRPTLFHPLWLVTGWLAAIFQLSAPAAFQLVRLLSIAVFVFLLHRIVSHMWTDRRWVAAAMAIVLVSGGLGWLTKEDFRGGVNLSSTPVDLWVAESTTFQSLAHSALFIGSQALLLFVFWQFARWMAKDPNARPGWIGPCLGLLALIHPYDLVTAGAVMVSWWAWLVLQGSAPPFRSFVRPALIWIGWVGIVVAYYWWIVLREPAMAGWLKQNLDWTSAPYLVIITYGVLGPLAAVGAFTQSRLRNPLLAMCGVWIVIGALLIYAPGLTFQRRLMSGLHLPVALLAVVGVRQIWEWIRWPAIRPAVAVGFFLLLAAGPIRTLSYDISVLIPGGTKPHYPERLTKDEYAAMMWLRQHTDHSAVIWSEVYLGNALPGFTGRTVVMGHAHQTLEIQPRLRDWEAFRGNGLRPTDRDAMLATLRVTHLVWRDEDQLDQGYRPALDGRWVLQFAQGPVQVFALRPEWSD